ncbi:MAG: radical SAM protein [Eubacteriaceae bacterium]|nr:radical SAM protein [Eubacteriaceae bacterium]
MHYVKTKGILSAKNGMNIYRGCLHGCIYCDSRSRCYGMEHDFEDVEVKENAVELLEMTLRKKRNKCMIGTGSMTDPYIPIEKDLGYVRKVLEVTERYGFGFTCITKSSLILRDMDILKRINEKTKVVVQMTLTTYDEDLCRIIEPFVATTAERYEVLKAFQKENIPTVVWLSPVLPFINDTEENLNGILDMCFDAGVAGIICFGMGLTLREGNREYFYKKLDTHFPGMKEKYAKTYGNNYYVQSPDERILMKVFHDRCETAGVMHDNDEIFTYLNTFEEKKTFEQMSLFDL